MLRTQSIVLFRRPKFLRFRIKPIHVYQPLFQASRIFQWKTVETNVRIHTAQLWAVGSSAFLRLLAFGKTCSRLLQNSTFCLELKRRRHFRFGHGRRENTISFSRQHWSNFYLLPKIIRPINCIFESIFRIKLGISLLCYQSPMRSNYFKTACLGPLTSILLLFLPLT